MAARSAGSSWVSSSCNRRVDQRSDHTSTGALPGRQERMESLGPHRRAPAADRAGDRPHLPAAESQHRRSPSGDSAVMLVLGGLACATRWCWVMVAMGAPSCPGNLCSTTTCASASTCSLGPSQLAGHLYNIDQAIIGIGSGGWLGRGLFRGSQSQLHFLRVRHTDFIFSVTAEELGFVGAALLARPAGVAPLAVGATSPDRCRDTFGDDRGRRRPMILFQTIINVGMNLTFCRSPAFRSH